MNPHTGTKTGTKPREEPPTLDRATFGNRLRSARKRFGWTLAQLAERSGVSITTISRAERGQLALGYENFTALGRALEMDMNAMFAGAGVKPAQLDGPVVTRSGKGVVYKGLSIAYEFLGTTAAGKQMSPIVGTVHARKIHGPEDFVRHGGEEFAYVLSGEIEVHFDNGEVVRMAKGDSLYFDSRLGHAYISVSRQLARIVGMTIGESGHMQSAREGEERPMPAPAARKGEEPVASALPAKASKGQSKPSRKAAAAKSA
ncbi:MULTISPECIES: helix-turn-helix domain-containing protein [Variovorax]|uniref:helix-turn-helix domain-containing protein n=1 Tax=Variovorax TaxID=34072 RepID=UPI00036877D9|nr:MULTISPECIES: XRE family transcriptional regulator [Variovorax]MDR6523424.1 transcriptional regulator with XRE-family HTH domain [Variovorax paradoxus]RTD85838.1 XRE family transcriptional regulator [Variovorax sp. 369]